MARKSIPDKVKNEVLALVNKVNAEKGRGGVAAASKQFKISAVTIGRWINAGASGEVKATKVTTKKETSKKRETKKVAPSANKAVKSARITAEVFVKSAKKVRVLEKKQEEIEKEIESLMVIINKYLG